MYYYKCKCLMNSYEVTGLRDMDIPAIVKDMGSDRQKSNILVYNSLDHESGFIRKKPFRSKHFSMIIVLQGVLDLKVNLLEYHLEAHDVIIIPPSAIREMNWNSDQTHFVALLFTPEFLKESAILVKYFDLANFVKDGLLHYCKIDLFDHAVLVQLLAIINTFLERKILHHIDLEITRNFFKAILLKVKQYYDALDTEKDISSTILYRFLKLLSEHYLSHREVSFYSENLNVNQKYLSQLLKKKTGKTARQFITEMVVLEAKVLLDNRSHSVMQIADLLNFENPFHFSRFFKQYTDMAPVEYRKTL